MHSTEQSCSMYRYRAWLKERKLFWAIVSHARPYHFIVNAFSSGRCSIGSGSRTGTHICKSRTKFASGNETNAIRAHLSNRVILAKEMAVVSSERLRCPACYILPSLLKNGYTADAKKVV